MTSPPSLTASSLSLLQIVVGVRVRPSGDRSTPGTLRLDPPRNVLDADSDRAWRFDHVWPGDASNGNVYDDVAAGIVSTVVEGYNGTLFAYGQTSSVWPLQTVPVSGVRCLVIVPVHRVYCGSYVAL